MFECGFLILHPLNPPNNTAFKASNITSAGLDQLGIVHITWDRKYQIWVNMGSNPRSSSGLVIKVKSHGGEETRDIFPLLYPELQ